MVRFICIRPAIHYRARHQRGFPLNLCSSVLRTPCLRRECARGETGRQMDRQTALGGQDWTELAGLGVSLALSFSRSLFLWGDGGPGNRRTDWTELAFVMVLRGTFLSLFLSFSLALFRSLMLLLPLPEEGTEGGGEGQVMFCLWVR